jgi:hypothetical protein
MPKSVKKGGHSLRNNIQNRKIRKSKTLKRGGKPRNSRSSLKGGKKKRVRCWTRRNSKRKSYVVCSGSKGQKGPRRSKRNRNKQKGGFFKQIKELMGLNPKPDILTQPFVAEPVVAEPVVAAQPVAESDVAKPVAAEQPVAEQPVDEQPVAEKVSEPFVAKV